LTPLAILESSFAIAIAVDFVLFVILIRLGRKRVEDKTTTPPTITTYWIGAFCEEDVYPSLGRFQLVLWTFVIVFAFVTVSLVRIFSGVPGSATFPANILTLLGVNASSTVISYGISGPKYDLGLKALDKKPEPLSTMLQENEQFSITRFQMFSWTIVALLIFLSTFFTLMTNLPSELLRRLPEVRAE